MEHTENGRAVDEQDGAPGAASRGCRAEAHQQSALLDRGLCYISSEWRAKRWKDVIKRVEGKIVVLRRERVGKGYAHEIFRAPERITKAKLLTTFGF